MNGFKKIKMPSKTCKYVIFSNNHRYRLNVTITFPQLFGSEENDGHLQVLETWSQWTCAKYS